MNSLRQVNPSTFLKVGILLVSFGILFGKTIAKLVQDWNTNDNYSHGYLVPFIVGYMIWQKKEELAKLDQQSHNLGLLIIGFGMISFIIGNIGAELFTMRTSIVITIAGLCVYSFGLKVASAIAIPLAYLMFMVPLPAIIWNKIAFPLQLFAATITSEIVQSIGIPLLREGNVLQLPNTTLEVVDACSGLRSLTSMLALSAAFAYIVKLTKISKFFLFFSAIPIAILVNIIRLTTTVFLAVYVGPEMAHGFLHDLSGIVVFILAMVMLFGLYSVVVKIERKFNYQ